MNYRDSLGLGTHLPLISAHLPNDYNVDVTSSTSSSSRVANTQLPKHNSVQGKSIEERVCATTKEFNTIMLDSILSVVGRGHSAANIARKIYLSVLSYTMCHTDNVQSGSTSVNSALELSREALVGAGIDQNQPLPRVDELSPSGYCSGLFDTISKITFEDFQRNPYPFITVCGIAEAACNQDSCDFRILSEFPKVLSSIYTKKQKRGRYTKTRKNVFDTTLKTLAQKGNQRIMEIFYATFATGEDRKSFLNWLKDDYYNPITLKEHESVLLSRITDLTENHIKDECVNSSGKVYVCLEILLGIFSVYKANDEEIPQCVAEHLAEAIFAFSEESIIKLCLPEGGDRSARLMNALIKLLKPLKSIEGSREKLKNVMRSVAARR